LSVIFVKLRVTQEKDELSGCALINTDHPQLNSQVLAGWDCWCRSNTEIVSHFCEAQSNSRKR